MMEPRARGQKLISPPISQTSSRQFTQFLRSNGFGVSRVNACNCDCHTLDTLYAVNNLTDFLIIAHCMVHKHMHSHSQLHCTWQPIMVSSKKPLVTSTHNKSVMTSMPCILSYILLYPYNSRVANSNKITLINDVHNNYPQHYHLKYFYILAFVPPNMSQSLQCGMWKLSNPHHHGIWFEVNFKNLQKFADTNILSNPRKHLHSFLAYQRPLNVVTSQIFFFFRLVDYDLDLHMSIGFPILAKPLSTCFSYSISNYKMLTPQFLEVVNQNIVIIENM